MFYTGIMFRSTHVPRSMKISVDSKDITYQHACRKTNTQDRKTLFSYKISKENYRITNLILLQMSLRYTRCLSGTPDAVLHHHKSVNRSWYRHVLKQQTGWLYNHETVTRDSS